MLTENQKQLLLRSYGLVYNRMNEYEISRELERIMTSEMDIEEINIRLKAINKILDFRLFIQSLKVNKSELKQIIKND